MRTCIATCNSNRTCENLCMRGAHPCGLGTKSPKRRRQMQKAFQKASQTGKELWTNLRLKIRHPSITRLPSWIPVRWERSEGSSISDLNTRILDVSACFLLCDKVSICASQCDFNGPFVKKHTCGCIYSATHTVPTDAYIATWIWSIFKDNSPHLLELSWTVSPLSSTIVQRDINVKGRLGLWGLCGAFWVFHLLSTFRFINLNV